MTILTTSTRAIPLPFGRRLPLDAIALLALYGIAVAVKFVWVTGASGPVVFFDEYLYKAAALSLFGEHGYFVDGAFSHQYPPLYSLVLAPAFLTGADWYVWMLRINALVSSSVVFPVWWIARKVLTRRQAWCSVLIASIIPFQIVTPLLVMSENLFLPLVLAVFATLMMDWTLASSRQLMAAGAIWALALLTRYNFLPALAVALLLWWAQPWIIYGSRATVRFRSRLVALAYLGLGFVLTFAPWWIYATVNDRNPLSAFGFGVVADHFKGSNAVGGPAGLVFWLVVYSAYAILMAVPYLHVLIAYPFSRIGQSRMQALFLLAFASLAATFFVTAVFYAWGAIPDRWYVEGRYMMYFVPLLPVVAFVALQRVQSVVGRTRIVVLWGSIGTAMVLLSVAYHLLISASPLELTDWFANITWMAVDVVAFHAATIPLFGSLIVLALLALLVYGLVVTWSPRLSGPSLAVLALVFYGASLGYVSERMPGDQRHAQAPRDVAALFEQGNGLGGLARPVTIIADPDTRIDKAYLGYSLEFWGVAPSQFAVRDWPSAVNGATPLPAAGIVLTARSDIGMAPIAQSNGVNVFVTGGVSIPTARPLKITDYGPRIVRAGQTFNRQPDGSFALWFKTENATRNTVLDFDGAQIQVDFGSSTLVSARIRPDRLTQPRTIDLFLFDTITHDRSNVVQLDVK
ncbi:MAG: hypothetical protein M1570_04165 [Chloroflexi bacterium]|nr:hypothetical protein [Chloroflexota bacterium]